MDKRCWECGAENQAGAEKCARCGAELGLEAPGDVEIEVYDVASIVEDKPGYFEETLAAARESVRKSLHEPPADLSSDPLIQEEIKPGYEIRKRRLGYRLRRSRHVAIIMAAAAALAVAVVYGVRWAVGRLPKYEYTEPAYAAPTDVALEMAVELESTRLEPAAEVDETTPLLGVAGEGGKIFLDGNYVADAPAADIPVAPGRHHVMVKRGYEIKLDETIDFKAREKYSLEPTAAAALAGPR
jgi:hypothetical protein